MHSGIKQVYSQYLFSFSTFTGN